MNIYRLATDAKIALTNAGYIVRRYPGYLDVLKGEGENIQYVTALKITDGSINNKHIEKLLNELKELQK